MRRFVLFAAIVLTAACAQEFTTVPGVPPDTTTTRDVETTPEPTSEPTRSATPVETPSPTPSPILGIAYAEVRSRFFEEPLAGVQVITTWNDVVIASAMTGTSGNLAIQIAEGGEITFVRSATSHTIFETVIGAIYRDRVFTASSPPPEVTIPVRVFGAEASTEHVTIRKASCLHGEPASDPVDIAVPVRSSCLSEAGTFDLIAEQQTATGFLRAALFDIAPTTVTSAIEMTLAPSSDSVQVSATLPAGIPEVTLNLSATRGAHCMGGTEIQGFEDDFATSMPAALTSADGILFTASYNSVDESVGFFGRFPVAASLDVTDDLASIPAVPTLPAVDTTDGVRFTFSPTGGSVASVLFAEAPGFRWFGILPPGATTAKIPPRPSGPITTVPVTVGIGTISSPESLAHEEWWRLLRICDAPATSHAFKNFSHFAF